MLFLASDHRGFALKEKIKDYLSRKSIVFEDLGAFAFRQRDDYPDYAQKLAERVLENKDNLGIALCGSGAGMSIALNKTDGIFAGLAVNREMAKAQKEQDNINVLVIPADFVSKKTALQIIDGFLKAKFLAKDRYIRRLKKIKSLRTLKKDL